MRDKRKGHCPRIKFVLTEVYVERAGKTYWVFERPPVYSLFQ